MARPYPRVQRLIRLIGLLQARQPLRAGDLARLCQTTERNIYRDLAVLRESGLAHGFDPDSAGYRAAPGVFMPPVELTFDEAMALLALAARVRAGLIPYLRVAGRALEKIRSQLPRPLCEAMATLDAHVALDLTPSTVDESARDVYERVRRAMATKRTLRCQYEAVRSAAEEKGEDEVFEFRPYVLWYCQRAWYAVGYHGGRQEVRHLKLSRFTACNLTDKPYAIPDGFNLKDHLGLAWRMRRGTTRYRVAVRFVPAFAETVCDTRWHVTQREEHEADGGVVLHFEVDGLEEIVWWVLGYGPMCKVIEPMELAKRVRELQKAAAEQYRRAPGHRKPTKQQ